MPAPPRNSLGGWPRAAGNAFWPLRPAFPGRPVARLADEFDEPGAGLFALRGKPQIQIVGPVHGELLFAGVHRPEVQERQGRMLAGLFPLIEARLPFAAEVRGCGSCGRCRGGALPRGHDGQRFLAQCVALGAGDKRQREHGGDPPQCVGVVREGSQRA